MLKALFSSKARVKLLTTFLLNPDEEFFIRELTRRLDEQINSIRRELDNLKKVGLLKSKVKNRKKYYYTNKEFILFEDLRNMVLKANNNDDKLIKQLSKLDNVELLLLNGSFAGKEAEVDLLMIGDVDKKKVESAINASKISSDIKFSIITKKDFLYRMEMKDKFIHDIVLDEDSVMVVNKLKKEIESIK